MYIKISKITFPLNKDVPHKESIGVIKELRYPVVKSNLKSIKDYGKEFDISRLLFPRI